MFEPKLTTVPGNKTSDARESDSFAVSVMHLESRAREGDDTQVQER